MRVPPHGRGRRDGVSRAEPGRPTWRLIRVALLLSPLFLRRSSAALDPERPLSQAQVDVWQTENGLPQNTVTSILRTRDGHLWFGTYDGLVRFDGARFTVFDGKTTPLLATGSAFALMEDRRGTLWIGRSENVVQYRDGVFRQVLGRRAGAGNRLVSLARRPTARSGPARGRASCAGRTARPPCSTKRDGLPAVRLRSVCVDKDGTLWIGTSGAGLVAMRDGRVTILVDGDRISERPDHHGPSRSGRAASGSRRRAPVSSGSSESPGASTARRTACRPTSSRRSRSTRRDRSASARGETGSAGCARDAFSCLGSPPLSNDKIWSILPDEEGFVWVGTWVGGLNRLRDRSFPPSASPRASRTTTSAPSFTGATEASGSRPPEAGSTACAKDGSTSSGRPTAFRATRSRRSARTGPARSGWAPTRRGSRGSAAGASTPSERPRAFPVSTFASSSRIGTGRSGSRRPPVSQRRATAAGSSRSGLPTACR